MRFLLDTNVLSELRKRNGDSSVRAWVSGQPSIELAVSVITILEIEIGIRRVALRDVARAEALRRWERTKVLAAFRGRILGIDLDVALKVAEYHVPDQAPQHDALIAGTAAVRGLTVVTRNVADFARTGIPVVSPWESGAVRAALPHPSAGTADPAPAPTRPPDRGTA